jgi:hypothetical protein
MYPELGESAQQYVVETIAMYLTGEGRRQSGRERAA